MARDKVFLSYRRDDARHIAEVRSAVHAAGYEDVDAPVEAILNATFFIACISANGYMRGELEAAIAQVRSGARDPAWLMVVRFGECPIPALPVAGFTMLPEFVVRIRDLDSRLGERATSTRIDLYTKTDDVMAPDAGVFALMADQEAIAGQNIKAKTDAHNVVGDRVAIVGSVLTGKRTWKP